MAQRPRIVVLGMMTKMPVAGVVWQTLHYLLGFERLGYETYYVEAHGRTPSMLMASKDDDSSARAAAFIAPLMRRFGLGGRWAFHALHDDGRHFGMSERQLRRLYGSADMLLNLHGGTEPFDELSATDRLVYLETDPVQLQFELAGGLQTSFDFLDAHCAFFTFAESYGRDDCGLPVTDRYPFVTTRQPVLIDHWQSAGGPAHRRFTTVGNWRQLWRDVPVGDEVYTWSKDQEFERFLDLPARAPGRFELALASYADDDRTMLEERGWSVEHALSFSMDLCGYRRYIADSYGEFTAAKEQNVRLRTGWFSDRSATYLASARPVITQDTGFGSALPTEAGLFPCSSTEEVLEAVERIDSDPEGHRRAAFEIAREYFAHDVVLGAVLDHLGMGRPPRRGIDDRLRRAWPFDLVLEPQSRRPTRLRAETVDTVMGTPLPPVVAAETEPVASIIVVSYNTLAFTRMCLESVLANTAEPAFELVVLDNASIDGSRKYLRALAERDDRVRVLENDRNIGFPAACNRGFALARGQYLILLNSDTMVAPGWLSRLLAPLDADPAALVGPVTNRIGNEAEVDTAYDTWGGYLREARGRAAEYAKVTSEIPTLTMFCLAMRRETQQRLGDLDERYGVGTLEDDDYSMRARREGLRLVLAEGVLVHHFGEASFGKLFVGGEYTRVLEENRARYAEKWQEPWRQYSRRHDDAYDQLVERIRQRIGEAVPDGATVLVVSKGDDRLVELNGLRALHFPATAEGGWAGHHPADGSDAMAHLRALEAAGAAYIAFPVTSFWWFDFYPELADHLRERELLRDDDCAVFTLGGSGR